VRSGSRLAALGIALLGGAALLAAGPLVGVGPARVDAAGPGLTMVGAAIYDVRPASHLVHVTVQLAATNHLSDTVIRRYTFDRVQVSVPPSAIHPAAKAGPKAVGVSVASRTSAQELLSVGLGGALGSGHTATVSLSFDLPDPGGATGRPIRVGPSLVTFPVWAYGSAGQPGSSVLVRFPAGFNVRVVSGMLGKPITASDGTISLSQTTIADPLQYNAVVAADQAGSFVDTPVSLTVAGQPAQLVVRAWSDDPSWGTRMSRLVKTALPLLATEIGLPFQPSSPEISIEEALPRSIDGYAADYQPAEGRIEIAYTADDTVAVHELAHLWFDNSLFADAWIDDGFAILYGNQVARTMKLAPLDESITPALAAAAQPLNAWSGTTPTTTATGTSPTSGPVAADLADRYGRAAALTLAGQLYTLVGADGLQAVWRAAAGREDAYQPAGQIGSATVASGPPDWRGLLDLIAQRTGVDASSLWSTWVVTPAEQPLLATRTGALAQLAATTARAGTWTLPPAILAGFNAWQFEATSGQLSGLGQILDQRDRIASAASAAGLVPPTTLQGEFEQGATNAAAVEAANELQVINAITTASAAQPDAPSLVQDVGLIGETPDLELSAAGTAFGAGDLGAARSQALAADTVWSKADDAGSFRIRIGLASILVALVLLGYVIVQLRSIGRFGRQARRRGQSAGSGRRARGTLAHQPVQMARRIRPGPDDGDHSP
jgi:hypothetical protein